MTKPPRAAARGALELARQPPPAYTSARSRKDFTSHQLFAILALKQFLKTDYRGVTAFIEDFAELRDDLGLKKVPNYSTLCYAEGRLLKKGSSSSSRSAPPRPHASARDRGLIPDEPTAAVDATGLESRHASRCFARRPGAEHACWAKLTAAVDTASHFLAGAAVTVGPSSDSPQFRPVLARASLAATWDRALADAAFDTGAHHAYARDEPGIRSGVTPINARGHDGEPGGFYRSQMPRRFRPKPEGSRHRRVFGQRRQAESAFSRHKRRLGSAVRPVRREQGAGVPTPRPDPQPHAPRRHRVDGFNRALFTHTRTRAMSPVASLVSTSERSSRHPIAPGQNSPRSGPPCSTSPRGRSRLSRYCVDGSIPSAWYSVAIRSNGCAAFFCGYAPVLSDSPYTCPGRTPPPATRQV
jgi:hypothetical protein